MKDQYAFVSTQRLHHSVPSACSTTEGAYNKNVNCPRADHHVHLSRGFYFLLFQGGGGERIVTHQLFLRIQRYVIMSASEFKVIKNKFDLTIKSSREKGERRIIG